MINWGGNSVAVDPRNKSQEYQRLERVYIQEMRRARHLIHRRAFYIFVLLIGDEIDSSVMALLNDGCRVLSGACGYLRLVQSPAHEFEFT